MKRWCIVVVALAIGVAQLSAAGSQEANEDEGRVTEYSFLTVFHEVPTPAWDNPNDVVSGYVEGRFGIRVSEVIFNGGVSPVERINMLVAADNVPDVVHVDNPNLTTFWNTGAFADITPYRSMLANYDTFVSDAGWSQLTVDGRLVAIPRGLSGGEVDRANPAVEAMIAEDIHYRGPMNWALTVNEDILRQAGYTFKSVQEVQDELDAEPRRITDEDVAIDPPLETVADLEEMLYRIQDLDLTVDGRPVIPLSLPDWAGYHMSVLYSPSPGFYADPETLEVSALLMNPGQKEFYQTWKRWYDDGVLDNDYLIHKPEQYTEKAGSGRVAVMFPGFDQNVVRENLQSRGSDLRVIEWPASTDGHSIDPSYPGGFENLMFNAEFEAIEEVLAYYDWTQTPEGHDLLTWGPEGTGIWEMDGASKVLADASLWEAIRDGVKTDDGRDAGTYGINQQSRIVLAGATPLYNSAAMQRSYEVKFDAYWDMFRYVTSPMLCRDGTNLPPSGAAANEVSSYYWSTVRTTKIAELLSTDTDREFDRVWEAILRDFQNSVDYEGAIEEMRPAFERALGR